jgi:hypothetical protein
VVVIALLLSAVLAFYLIGLTTLFPPKCLCELRVDVFEVSNDMPENDHDLVPSNM